MDPVAEILLFASAATLAFIVSLFASDEDWLLSVSSTGALLIFWAVNTAIWLLGHFGVASLVSDTAFTAGGFVLFLASRRRWLLALSVLYGIDVLVDVLFARGWLGFAPMAQVENVIFMAQLGAASWPGWTRLRPRRRPGGLRAA